MNYLDKKQKKFLLILYKAHGAQDRAPHVPKKIVKSAEILYKSETLTPFAALSPLQSPYLRYFSVPPRSAQNQM